MNQGIVRSTALLILALGLATIRPAQGQQVRLIARPPDPHGTPRPARDARNVPLRTSLYLELGMPPEAKSDRVDPESVAIHLRARGGESIEILGPGRRFAKGASGWMKPKQDLQGTRALAVYIEPGVALEVSTRYTVRVSARSRGGAELRAAAGTWSFTTEDEPAVHPLSIAVDFNSAPVRWHGAFFSGVCKVVFCTDAETHKPTDDLMAEARKRHPRAWSYQRDFWTTGTEDTPPSFLPQRLPNIVRERETRRIARMEQRAGGVLLHVEDFFGHQQYGIPSGRPVGEDYHPGDEVLIADGLHDALSR